MSSDQSAKGVATKLMPDIANEAKPMVAGKLDWVGMNAIEMPIRLDTGNGELMETQAQISALVNLTEPQVRGIHMSRLYLHLDRQLGQEPVNIAMLRGLLKSFLDSHEGLSNRAMVRLDFDFMVRRGALSSGYEGWKHYPVTVVGLLEGQEFTVELGVEVQYSSTCPCSAALARQLIQEQFRKDFGSQDQVDADTVFNWLGSEQGIVATPHSQRSGAEVRVKLKPAFEALPVIDLVNLLESALKTPVQAAVKREDEQEFALLNGQNLMFCEDAGRRVQTALCGDDRILDFWARCTHYESLHPHNAVSVVTKGIEGGYVGGAGTPVRLGYRQEK